MSLGIEAAFRIFQNKDLTPRGDALYWFKRLPKPVRDTWKRNQIIAQRTLRRAESQLNDSEKPGARDRAIVRLQITRILTSEAIHLEGGVDTYVTAKDYYDDNIWGVSRLEAQRILGNQFPEDYWQATERLAVAILHGEANSPNTLKEDFQAVRLTRNNEIK